MRKFLVLSCVGSVAAAISVFLSCAAQRPTAQVSSTIEETFDWNHEGPLEFIELLKGKASDSCPTFVISGVPDNWVTEAHISHLMQLVDSEEPCANVCSVYSSYYDCSPSTVGQEAAFIIEGFRKGKYPPVLNSGRTIINKEGLKRWGKDYMGQSQ